MHFSSILIFLVSRLVKPPGGGRGGRGGKEAQYLYIFGGSIQYTFFGWCHLNKLFFLVV